MSLDHNLTLKEQLINVQDRMDELAKPGNINDKDFINDPLARIRAIMSAIEEKSKQKEESYEKVKSFSLELKNLREYAEKSKSDPSISDLSSSINKIQNEMRLASNRLNVVIEELQNLSNISKKISSDRNYIEFLKLFKKRSSLRKKLNIDRNNMTNEIKALRCDVNGKKGLCENIVDILEKNTGWYENFKRIHEFEFFSKNPVGLSPVLFKSPKGDIEVTEDAVRFKGQITTDTMAKIVPALIALFLKCIDSNKPSGCLISDQEPLVIDHIERMLADAMKERSPSFTINGKSIHEIQNGSIDPLSRADMLVSEPLKNSFTKSN